MLILVDIALLSILQHLHHSAFQNFHPEPRLCAAGDDAVVDIRQLQPSHSFIDGLDLGQESFLGHFVHFVQDKLHSHVVLGDPPQGDDVILFDPMLEVDDMEDLAQS